MLSAYNVAPNMEPSLSLTNGDGMWLPQSYLGNKWWVRIPSRTQVTKVSPLCPFLFLQRDRASSNIPHKF